MNTFTLRSYLPFGFGTGEFDQTVALKVSSTFQMIAPLWFILIFESVVSVIPGFSVEPFSGLGKACLG